MGLVALGALLAMAALRALVAPVPPRRNHEVLLRQRPWEIEACFCLLVFARCKSPPQLGGGRAPRTGLRPEQASKQANTAGRRRGVWRCWGWWRVLGQGGAFNGI